MVEVVDLGVARGNGHLRQVQMIQLLDVDSASRRASGVVEHEMHQIRRARLSDGGEAAQVGA